MPQYFKDSTGKMHEFPDDATPEEIDEATRAIDAPATPAAPTQPAAPPPPQDSVARTLGIGGRAMLEGVASIPDIIGTPMAVGLNKILPENMQQTDVRGGVGFLLDKAGVPRAETANERVGAGVTSAIAGAGVPIAAGRQMMQRAPGIIRGAGESLAALPGVQMASSALSSLGSEVAREAGASPLVQAAVGLAGGLLPGQPVGKGAQAAQNPELPRIAAEAAQRGIQLRPGGVDPDGVLGFLRNLPMTGSRGRYAEDVAKVNERLAETIGAPAGTAPDRVYAAARSRATADYDDFAQRIPLTVTNPVITKIANYRNTTPELGGAEPAARVAIDEFMNEVAQLGTRQVPGELFKRLDTALGSVPYNKNSYGNLRSFIQSLRNDYKAGMTPDDAARWDDLGRRYGDMKTLENLYAKASGQMIDPKDILGAVTTGRSGKQRKASGTRGELGVLADIGQRIKEPKSSIASGLASLSAALGAGVAASPLTGLATLAGSNLAGRVADNPWLTQFMSKPAKASTRAPAAKAAAIGTASSEQSRKKKKLKP